MSLKLVKNHLCANSNLCFLLDLTTVRSFAAFIIVFFFSLLCRLVHLDWFNEIITHYGLVGDDLR